MANLQPNESVLKSGAVTWVGPQGPPRTGTLSVTNLALIFEGPIPWGGGGPRGPMMGRGPMMRPGPRMMRPMMGGGPPPMPPGELRIPLWRCRGATAAAGGPGAGLTVQLLSRQIFFTTENPVEWAAVINQARAAAPPAPPGAMGGPGAGPGRAAMPRCEYCGQLSQAAATKCEHCGAPF